MCVYSAFPLLYPIHSIYCCAAVTLPLPNSKVALAQRQPYRCAAVNNLDGSVQGKRIINLLDAAIDFSQIISLLSHTDYTNFTEHTSLSLVCASGMLTLGKADSRERSDAALCEICAICVKINHLT